MNANWQSFLNAAGARLNATGVANFGNADAELASAREATIVSPLTHLGILDWTGEDAKTFLHNQLTSDINHLAPDAVQLSAWCTAKGRMQASFQMFRGATGYRGLLSADLVTATQTGLKKYILRSKVRIDDLSGTHEIIGLAGANSATALAAANLPYPEQAGKTAGFAHGTVVRLADDRIVIACAAEAAPELWQKIVTVARPVGTAVWQWLDVHSGIPLIVEATKEAFVPQMVSFDKLGGVSFHKGCYPGQEVVARTQYLGKIKRHLYALHAATPMSAGMPIYAPENPQHPCGQIANAAAAPDGGFDALAVLQESFAEQPGLGLGVPGGPSFSIESI